MSRPRNAKSARPVDSRKDSIQRAQLFRVVAETATDAIITIDEKSVILFVNKAAERIFGYADSEMMGREVTMLMPDYLREMHRRAVGRYLQTGEKHIPWTAVKLTGLRRNGTEFPIEVSLGEHIHGKRRIFTGIVRDISDREKAEALLRQSEEKYAKMVHSSPDAITLRSLPDRRYLEVNEGFTRLTGYSAEEVLGKTPGELNLWVEPEPHRTTLERVEAEGQVSGEEFRFRTKSGQRIHVSVTTAPVKVAEGTIIGARAIARDVTDRKRVDEKLMESESEFRSLVHDAPHGIYRVTLRGRLLQVNPALVKMLGYESEEELMRCNVEKDIYRDPEARQRLVGDYWQKQDLREVEAEWRRNDGKTIVVKMTGHPVLEKDHSLAYLEVFAEDITERRSLERQLLQSQKMEAIGRLAGGIAHDFNNLLGVILGHSDILDQ